VIDNQLRVAKDRVVAPLVARVPAAVTSGRLTVGALVFGVATGLLAASGWRWWSLAAWLLGRVFDVVDGAVARQRGHQSDLGGYLDLMGDTVSYAAVPLGIAASQSDARVWAACAVLLASFYLNTMSWTLLAAIAAKRAVGATTSGDRTTVHMPPGLVEGAETIVLFAVLLALSTYALVLFWVMTGLVTITIVQRVVWAVRSLR
jgi:phosphatidylglycerophosphate synthase